MHRNENCDRIMQLLAALGKTEKDIPPFYYASRNWRDEAETARIETHYLKVLEIEAWKMVDDRFAQELNRRGLWSEEFEHMRQGVIHRMAVRMLSKNPTQVPAGRAPADWWQALKERFAPRWFLQMFPVEYYHFWVTAQEVYPLLDAKIPGEYRTIRFMTQKQMPEQFTPTARWDDSF